MSEPRVVERRAHRRVKLTFPVRIHVDGVEGFSDFTAANVSRGGVFIATDFPYPVGTRLSLEMTLPKIERPVPAKGSVVRCLPCYDEEEGAAGMGIRFRLDSSIDWALIEKQIGF